MMIEKIENLRSARTNLKSRIKRWILKKKLGTTYITADLFYEIISPELKSTYIEWSLFNMHGTLYPEAGKLKPFIQMYNSETLTEINTVIDGLNLPNEYYSVQICGGDKITETEH